MQKRSPNERGYAGIGFGLRPVHYAYIKEQKPNVPFFEILTENYLGLNSTDLGGAPLRHLLEIREHYPVSMHGVSLSIGSCDELNANYLNRLSRLVDILEPTAVSDHLCWTSFQGRYFHDLLPLPYNRSTLNFLVPRIQAVQERLGRAIALENVSSYVELKESDISEPEFLNELAAQSGCRLLLDVNNVYVNAENHGFDPKAYVKAILPKHVEEYHVSGHTVTEEVLIDTHDSPVAPAVGQLFAFVKNTVGDRPTVIEWDDKIPEFPHLLAQKQILVEASL